MGEAGLGSARGGPLARGAAGEDAAANNAARERFLTVPMGAALTGFLLFAVTFDNVKVDDDGLYYFTFVRRLFGEDVVARAYQFGSSFWTAPFYLAGRLVASRGGFDPYHAAELATTVASNVAAVVILYLGWRILRELDLPRNPAVLLLALFGTPLYFYAVLRPAYKHAADTLYMTAAVWFLLRGTREERTRDLAAAGACLGLMLATRYANVAILAGVVVMFGLRRAWRPLWTVLTVTMVVGALLYAVPVVRHIPFDADVSTSALASDGPPLAFEASSVRLAADRVGNLPGTESVKLDPTVPAKMLFTLHRGLFVWTPLTAFATVGFVLLLRRERRDRAFLAGLAASALALLAIHSLWGNFWDGGGSFSARFLTALFPVFLIGAAEFVRRWRWPALAVLIACALWSVWLGLVLTIGYNGFSANDGLRQILPHYTGPINRPYDSLGNFSHKLRLLVEDRWGVLKDELS